MAILVMILQQVDTTVLGLSAEEAKKKPYIASMGIYVFKKSALRTMLKWRFPELHDFGSQILPRSTVEYNVQAYLFNDYWEDIGTIKSFFDANLALTAPVIYYLLLNNKYKLRCFN